MPGTPVSHAGTVFETQNVNAVCTSGVANSPTFRHPLPPSLARPARLPLSLPLPATQMVVRTTQRLPINDPRLQVQWLIYYLFAY